MIKKILGVSVVVGLLFWGFVRYTYSQQFVQDSKISATQGIFFKKTLNLEVYSRVSNGNGWLGRYDRYSRSDRHTDVLTVYCKSYCSK